MLFRSDEVIFGSGYTGGNGSGQIASKFKLLRTDTILGFQAFFGSLNQSWDDISLAIYGDAGGRGPGSIIPGSLIYKSRGFDDIREDYFLDEYVTYLYDTPLILPSGTFWAVIGQLGETGLELGASKSRMGMRTTNVSIPIPTNTGGPTGGGGTSLLLEKNFRVYAGRNLINKSFFAVNNGRGSGVWSKFMPNIGNPAYGHLHHFGISPDDYKTATLSRGSWIPMIRPYLGERSYYTDGWADWCVPVELLFFTGDVRSKGINLEWATESEDNNYGFYIERRLHNLAVEEEWEAIKQHPLLGASLLSGSASPLLELAKEVALTHHERWDGTGYPCALKGEKIPIAGRIVMLCDLYDALRSRRPYKPAYSHTKTLDIIDRKSTRLNSSHTDISRMPSSA